MGHHVAHFISGRMEVISMRDKFVYMTEEQRAKIIVSVKPQTA